MDEQEEGDEKHPKRIKTDQDNAAPVIDTSIATMVQLLDVATQLRVATDLLYIIAEYVAMEFGELPLLNVGLVATTAEAEGVSSRTGWFHALLESDVQYYHNAWGKAIGQWREKTPLVSTAESEADSMKWWDKLPAVDATPMNKGLAVMHNHVVQRQQAMLKNIAESGVMPRDDVLRCCVLCMSRGRVHGKGVRLASPRQEWSTAYRTVDVINTRNSDIVLRLKDPNTHHAHCRWCNPFAQPVFHSKAPTEKQLLCNSRQFAEALIKRWSSK